MIPVKGGSPFTVKKRIHIFEDDLCLVDRSGRIIAARTAGGDVIGRSFFELYPMPPREKKELHKLLYSFGVDAGLFRAGRHTRLFLKPFFVETECFAVVLPHQGPTRQVLDSIGSLAESFSPLYVSAGVRALGAPPSEERYRILQGCLYPYLFPLFPDPEGDFINSYTLSSAMYTISEHIARMAGCRLTCNFDVLGLVPLERFAPDRMSGVLMLLCLMARRAAQDRHLHFLAETLGINPTAGEGTFTLFDRDDPLPELTSLKRLARECNFDLETHRRDGRVTIRFDLTLQEYSKQVAKVSTPYKRGIPNFF